MNDTFCIEYKGDSIKRNEPFYFVKSLGDVPADRMPPPKEDPFVYIR